MGTPRLDANGQVTSLWVAFEADTLSEYQTAALRLAVTDENIIAGLTSHNLIRLGVMAKEFSHPEQFVYAMERAAKLMKL